MILLVLFAVFIGLACYGAFLGLRRYRLYLTGRARFEQEMAIQQLRADMELRKHREREGSIEVHDVTGH